MNPDKTTEDFRKTSWPGLSAALPRLLLMALVMFPFIWALHALLTGSWRILGNGDPESIRHFVEAMAGWLVATGMGLWLSWRPWFDPHFSRRNGRRLLFGLACLVTFAALFYAEENWRGERAWNHYRQSLEAGGAQLDYASFIPKPVPDEQNFAATPVVKSWFVEVNRDVVTNTTERFAKNWSDNYEHAFNWIPGPNPKSRRQFMDLVSWEKGFAALRSGETNSIREFPPGGQDLESRRAAVPFVLEGLKVNEAALTELREASQRPLARYPVFYDLENPWGIFCPHLINVRDACRRLQLRACAELAAGRSDEALTDVKLMLYLADTIKTEPFFISFLVRCACVHYSTQPAWEGLTEHAWTTAQLEELQTLFQSYNFVKDIKVPFDGELALGSLTADMARKNGLGVLIAELGPESPASIDIKLANWCSAFIPSGWFAREKVNYCRYYQLRHDGTIDPDKKRISPGRIEANSQATTRELATGTFVRTAMNFFRHQFIAAWLLPSLTSVSLRSAATQTVADQAALACALERYRLAQGQYPETLTPLVPQYVSALPNDALTGEPYHYRRLGDGHFVLYSVGWNEQDDGGKPGDSLLDDKQGDWVWQYPAN